MLVEAIMAVLGGANVVECKPRTMTDLISVTREGLPAAALATLADGFSIDRKAISRLLGVGTRRLEVGPRLTVAETDRTLRCARVFVSAVDVIGTRKTAAQWLQTSNRALLGSTPFELLDTDAGVQMVETLLGRIAYGIYS
jgi:putative toxin-antitoxin system antitoxin component (TIGR02293 family)